MNLSTFPKVDEYITRNLLNAFMNERMGGTK